MKERALMPAEETETKEAPQFLKEFSRKNSSEERDMLAASIRESRRKRDGWQAEHDGHMEERNGLVEEMEGLRGEIGAYENGNLVTKVKDYFAYRSAKAKLEEKLGPLGRARDRVNGSEAAKPDFGEARELLDGFYDGEKKKWADAGHTPEDIAENFTEERLSSLSVEDYALLMRRFPGEMLTHVTRQGIRDHAGSIWHTAGEGNFQRGFESMLEDGKLRSNLGIALKEHGKEEAMEKFLRLDKLGSREEALAMLTSKFEANLVTENGFADSSAVHLAAEQVMDEMYGSERRNEIFVAFPAAYAASQLRFGGKGKLTEGNGGDRNDKFIYTKDHEGMPLDAGLVFIPEDAMVDPETGSRYEIGEDGEPIEPTQRVQEIYDARFGEKKGFIQTFVQDLSHKMATLPEKERAELAAGAFEEFGINDPEARKALLDNDLLTKLADVWGKKDEQEEYGKILRTYFNEHAENRYETAKETIPSKEYWERYFQLNPEQRPSKVVYYSGGDPSRALNRWRKGNDITKGSEDPTFGFSEHEVSTDSPEANEGKERFMSLARKVIDDRFPETEQTRKRAEEERLESVIA
ncbi:MAG: hypothetical protein HGA31_02495 [Candidatus Moranbacteria bacterium]|nr:hypothetical protein [Candidatus Moranbacteria bacterium]